MNRWKSLGRDLAIDLSKGYGLNGQKLPFKARNCRLVSLSLEGNALISNFTIPSSIHHHFKKATEWLLNNQDEIGGWPIKVTRRLGDSNLILHPGWYSAMAQGQCISLLIRGYHVTKDSKFIDAALRASKLFDIDSANKGIRTHFMDKYVWFEEYPTRPSSSFVLNGFMYSLFGLFDLHSLCSQIKVKPPEELLNSHSTENLKLQCDHVSHLYHDGLISLKNMLPLYDTGAGSLYDLRHVALGIAPNLARWDYHATHINQLFFLSTITEPQMVGNLLKSTAKRWIGYMHGKRAAHN